jgi:long-chain fatty acid transport protein
MRAVLRVWVVAALAAVTIPTAVTAQPGLYLPGNGAVQGAMAGASTAAPLDAMGALYWNPAAIGRLGRNEVSIGGAFIYPDISVSSSLPRPLQGRVESGRTRSDNGFPLASSLGLVYQLEDGSPVTYGFGLLSLGGGGVNFPGDPGNPALSPTGPFGQTVIGPIAASIQLYQLNPTVSYRASDRLTVGAGPTIDVTVPSFDPAFFAAPDRDGNGRLVFPTATHSRPYWGGGFRAGLVYAVTDTLDVGFGYTSPQWLDEWRFNARTPDGQPRTLFLQAMLPAIYSWGVGYRGIDRLTLGVDLRYFDYESTDLFGTPVRDGGLGWESAFAVALGGQYVLTDRVAVRAGYQYNTNPLASTSTLFNIQSPAIIQHVISVGATVGLTDSVAVSVGYAYGFRNSITGTAREIPGAGITLDAASHSLLFNLQIKFGSCGCKPSCGPTCDSAPVATQTTPRYDPVAVPPGSPQPLR